MHAAAPILATVRWLPAPVYPGTAPLDVEEATWLSAAKVVELAATAMDDPAEVLAAAALVEDVC